MLFGCRMEDLRPSHRPRHCDVCDVTLSSVKTLFRHQFSAGHRSAVIMMRRPSSEPNRMAVISPSVVHSTAVGTPSPGAPRIFAGAFCASYFPSPSVVTSYGSSTRCRPVWPRPAACFISTTSPPQIPLRVIPRPIVPIASSVPHLVGPSVPTACPSR